MFLTWFRFLSFRVGLVGLLFLGWLWYESLTNTAICTVTRQSPSIAMQYSIGFAEGGFVATRNGVTGAIGTFLLGSPGWSFDAERFPHPWWQTDFFPLPSLDLRHPENRGYLDQPGATSHYSSLLVPVWLLLLIYLVVWFWIMRWRIKCMERWCLQQEGKIEA